MLNRIRSVFAPLGRSTVGLLLAWGMFASATWAQDVRAATIEIRGPAGTQVRIDGQERGTLPLGAPLEVEPGVRIVECRRVGYLVHTEPVLIDGPESAVRIELEMQPLSRTRAVGSSVVLAGLGQLYQGRTRIGWTMVALQGAAWLTAAWAETEFKAARDDYELLDRQYDDAILETEIVRLRGERDAAYSDLESAKDVRTAAIAAVVVIGAWSVFDAWRAHSGFFADAAVPVRPETALGAGTPDLQWRLGWRARF